MTKYQLLACAALTVSGCTTNGALYDWGNYEENLFSYYHKPVAQSLALERHLEHLSKLERRGAVPAPGLLAEAGTLYLLMGDESKAAEYYQMEHDAWPESRPLMSALITSLNEEK